jgi:hypothetical protein
MEQFQLDHSPKDRYSPFAGLIGTALNGLKEV